MGNHVKRNVGHEISVFKVTCEKSLVTAHTADSHVRQAHVFRTGVSLKNQESMAAQHIPAVTQFEGHLLSSVPEALNTD